MNTDTLSTTAAPNAGTKPTRSSRIPMPQKIAFGIGMLANQMFPAALGIFMVILVQSLGMRPMLWGLIVVITKIVEEGKETRRGERDERTEERWGKRRPFRGSGAVVEGLA